MKIQLHKFDNTSDWVNGYIDNLQFEAKLFDTGSIFGINNGRVSKLHIWNKKNEDIVSYDRNWDIKPNKENSKYYKAIMKFLENLPKRFD